MSTTRAEVNGFYHGPVDIGNGNTADYVTAHALRQRRRGKKPSVTYKGITNPSFALEAAQKDLEARATGSWSEGTPFFLNDFSGMVAVMHATDDDRQQKYAAEFAKARMRDGRCVGAVIMADLETLPIDMDPAQVNPDGTVEVPYLYAP